LRPARGERGRVAIRKTRWPVWAGAELLLGGFACLGLFYPVSALTFSSAVGGGAPQAATLAALGLALSALFDLARRFGRHRRVYACLAGFYTICVLLDRSFVSQSNWNLLFGSAGDCFAALWIFVSLTLVLYAAITLLAAGVSALVQKDARLAAATPRPEPRGRFWLFFGILLLCWLPHIITQAPGVIETTAGQQIREAFGELPYTDDNPIFHTLLLKLLIKGSLFLGLGDTMAVMVVSLSQIIPLALALAWTLTVVRRMRVPRALVWALLGFYGLCPLFAYYGFFIVKDVPFAIAALLLTCELAEICLRKDSFFLSGWNCLLHIAIGASLCFMRNAGVALYGLSMIAAFPLLRLRGRSLRRMAACTLAALALYAGFTAAANAALNVTTLATRQAETRSLQCQVVARVVKEHGAELTAGEIAVIDACLPVDGMAENYLPEVSDPVKDTWRADATAEATKAFDRLSLRLALRYPGTSAQAFLQMAIPYLALGDVGRFRAIFDYGFPSLVTLYPVFKPKHLFSSDVFRFLPDYFQSQPLISFFCCSGFYASLLIGCVVLLIRRRRFRMIACYVPPALVLLGCMFSPVAGYVRYALPFMFSAPFLAAAAVKMLTERAEP
jgi:hypothetical protein